jgi:3-(3-hydroxy-phenyl)propionate hydroxylase
VTSSSEDKVGEFTYVRHAPRLPALDDGVDTRTCAVAIAGGGPVGLALALGLAVRGISSVVLEADDTVCIGSRAACISRRSLEIVDRLGALPSFLGKGLAWTGGRSFFKTREVFRLEMPHDSRQRLPPMINLQQYYIEQYLVDAIERDDRGAASGSIDLRWGTEVTGFRDRGKAVEIDLHTALGDYRMRADWLVACDGGQSLVRKALDLPLVGTAYEGRYVIIDIHLPSRHPTERRAWFDPPWNPGSTVLMHRQVDDIWRIDYQLRAGDDTATALQPANVQHFVQKHLEAIGEGHLPWRTIWTSVYRAGAMTLESYRHGRVLFAGNAAHALPIFGVRGLNSGFDDADNLAWKLALVVQGQAGEALLESYSQERVEAFHINAANAMRSTEFMSPPSRGFDLLREAALSLAVEHPDIASLVNPRQTEAVAYRASPLSSPDDSDLPGAAPGALLPDFPLRSPAGHLTQVLGTSFTLLAFVRAAAEDLSQPAASAAASAVAARAPVDLDLLLCLAQALVEGAAEAGVREQPEGAPLRQPKGVAREQPEGVARGQPEGVARGQPEGGPWRLAAIDDAVLRAHAPEAGALYLLRPDRHVAARRRLRPQDTQAVIEAWLDEALRRACGMDPSPVPDDRGVKHAPERQAMEKPR